MCTGGSAVDVGVAAGRRESRTRGAALHEAGDRAGLAPRGERVEQRDRRALAVAGDGVVHAERVEEGLRSDAEGGAAGDDARRRARRRAACRAASAAAGV